MLMKQTVDSNFFASEDQNILKRSEVLGWDKNSVLGDPMFVDPATGDFRVKEGSPALAIGFKNFPMDQFGVKKPSLKAIAKTPSLESSVPDNRPRRSKAMVSRSWLGATLVDLKGNDFSAYGVSKEEAGAALKDVPKDSQAEQAGLRSRDLIQGVDGNQVKNIKQLFKALSSNKSESVTLKVVRDQQPLEITVKLPAIVEIETSSRGDGFEKLRVPDQFSWQSYRK